MTIYVQRFKEGNEDNQCCNRIMIIEMVQVCFSTPFQTKNGQICHDNPLTFKVDHLHGKQQQLQLPKNWPGIVSNPYIFLCEKKTEFQRVL